MTESTRPRPAVPPVPPVSPGPVVHGALVDDQTRCVHWSGPTDVIAIRFRCCDDWYPCADCHQDAADHSIRRWSRRERDAVAVLCGACRSGLTVSAYLALEAGDPRCPACGAGFNPGCSRHHHLYFEPDPSDR